MAIGLNNRLIGSIIPIWKDIIREVYTMKLLRSILRYAALILVVGGIVVILGTYWTKKEILMALVSNTIVKSSMSVLKTIAMAVGAVFAGLILFIFSMRLSSNIRRIERERNAELKAKEKETKEEAKRLQKEAEEARAEAEKVKKENELMRQTFMKEPEETSSDEQA